MVTDVTMAMMHMMVKIVMMRALKAMAMVEHGPSIVAVKSAFRCWGGLGKALGDLFRAWCWRLWLCLRFGGLSW